MMLPKSPLLIVFFLCLLLFLMPCAPLPATGNEAGGLALAAPTPRYWENVSPNYFHRDRTSVSAVDADTAWVVADHGTIIKTTDGGASWKLQRTGTESLTSVCAVDARTAWAVGYSGVVLKTSDGGETWLPQGPGTGNLYSVSAVDADTAWAVGDEYGTLFNTYIIKTEDGGATWTRQEPFGGWGLTDVSAVDIQRAWAVRSQTGEILQTQDGGATWTTRFTPQVPNMNFYRVDAVDAGHVWAVDWAGHLVKTDDGGDTWTVVDLAAGELRSVSAASPSTGWVVGAQGVILRTVNGWQTWDSQYAGTPAPSLRDVFALNGSTAWAVGDSGVILRTSDGGAHWSSCIDTTGGFTAHASRVAAGSSLTAWVVEDELLKTADGGATWTTVALPPHSDLRDVSALDEKTVWVVVNENGAGSIYKSSDGGATWELHYSAPAGVLLFEVYVVNASLAWALGSGGFIAKTTDGGKSWSSPGTVTGAHGELLSICGVDGARAWVTAWSVVYSGVPPKSEPPFLDAPYYPIIMKTEDGGATWSANQAGTYNEGFADISAAGADRAMAVGRDVVYSPIPGIVLVNLFPMEYYFYLVTLARYGGLVTWDGGNTWSPQALNAPFALNAVDMVDAGTAWAVGSGGNIFKTGDGGENWTPEISRTTATLREVDAVDAGTAWAVGDDGTILRTAGGAPPPSPPVVTSVTPQEAGQLSFAIDLTVQGSGFREGASLGLEKDGTTIQASNVTVTSETQLTATVILFGAEPGAYDVVVTNPDSLQGRLAGGFTVTPACGAGSGAAALAFGISLGLLSLAGSLKARRRARRRVLP